MGVVWQWFLKSLSPQQICWLCLLATILGGMYGVRVFAKNTDVEAIRIELLQSRLLDLRLRQCQAIKAGQPAAFFAGQIQEHDAKFRALTGTWAPLPGCGEL